eukprot:scaffold30372_cov70-Cyclotella_meneghiniana.AAC.2
MVAALLWGRQKLSAQSRWVAGVTGNPPRSWPGLPLPPCKGVGTYHTTYTGQLSPLVSWYKVYIGIKVPTNGLRKCSGQMIVNS